MAISTQTVILRPLGFWTPSFFSSSWCWTPSFHRQKVTNGAEERPFGWFPSKAWLPARLHDHVFKISTAARSFFKNSCISKSKCGSTVVHFLWNGVEPLVSTCSTKPSRCHRGSLKTLWKIASKSRWRQEEELFCQSWKVLMCIGKSLWKCFF